MYRQTLRSTPQAAKALRQSALRSSPRRFASSSSAEKPRTWKGTALRWGLAVGAVYYYNTSPVFADEPSPRTVPEPPHFSDSDLKTVDAVIDEKRQKGDLTKPKPPTSQQPAQPTNIGASAAVAPAAPSQPSPEASIPAEAGSPEALEEEAGQQGAFNPETGEINWDCPCLGGMADGPCGEEFKAAFSCFVYSTEEPKGIECIDKFQGMQDCFRKHPEVYGSELQDDEQPQDEGPPPVNADGDATPTPSPAPARSSELSEPHEENANEKKDPTTQASNVHPARAAEAAPAETPAKFSDATSENKKPGNAVSESWADVASKGPEQTAEEAAAPHPPEISTNAETSTSSLVDVDQDHVQTVPSDFLDQDVKTETQAERVSREEEAKAESEKSKKKKAADKAHRADNWLTRKFASLSDGSAGALAAVNIAGVVALSGFLGYRAWGLYDRGRLSWQNVSIGLGILGVVGVGESVLGGYLYKTKRKN